MSWDKDCDAEKLLNTLGIPHDAARICRLTQIDNDTVELQLNIRITRAKFYKIVPILRNFSINMGIANE